jgi:hypothetical protein
MKRRPFNFSLITILLICVAGLCMSCGSGSGGGGEDSISSVSVTIGSASIIADGASQTQITATVTDSKGKEPDGVTVSFTATAGTLSASSATTSDGVARVTLTSPTNVGTATIRATAGGVSGQSTITFVPGAPDEVIVTATPSSLTADGSSTSSISATVLDAHDNAVADGEMLSFSADAGTLSQFTTTTSGGKASVTYTAPRSVPDGDRDTITVQTTNGLTASAVITLTGPEIASISLSANPSSLPADGSSTATITAAVTVVGGGEAPDGTTVTFSIEEGGGRIGPDDDDPDIFTATTSGGVAYATLTSGSVTATATIQAEAGGITEEIEVAYVPGSVTLTIVPNSLLGTGEETATVTATLTDAEGSVAPDGETVNFTLDDLSLGTIPPSGTTAGGEGEATVTFQAAAKGGTVTVTATWTTGGVDVTGSETITIQQPPGFMEVSEGSPEPAAINIKGTGGQSTSLITFDVKDIQGNLVADGYRVDFMILSGPDGGEELSPLMATTESGQVSTILRSGFKSGPVSIKATYFYDTSISTTVGQISIVGGPPVGEEFGIAAEYLNISGLWMAGLEDGITISANDVYGNAVPNDTTISFKTYETGGDFDPGSALTSGGFATSTLISFTPEPAQGFVSVTAEAVNGGRTTHVTSLAVSPYPYQNILYAGTDGGGIYKSTDSGTTWSNVSRSSAEPGQNWMAPYVNDVAVDPDDDNVVYAATGYLGEGNVYRSLDGGINWNSNNVEEWNGVVGLDAAILSLICDNNGSDYVWIGTQGQGALLAPDGETFGWGGIVGAVSFTGTGNGTMSTPILSSTSKTETWTVTYAQTGAEVSTPVLTSSGNADGTMTDVSADNDAPAEDWTVTYAGGIATGPTADPGNTGNGTMAILATTADTVAEDWTVECMTAAADGGEFRVMSTQSGIQSDNYDITTGNYTATDLAGNDVVTFYILDGTADFIVGDKFTFSTSDDGWSVVGSVSGAQQDARTDTAYTSDSGEVSFTINSGASRFYKNGDNWTFTTTATGSWLVVGTSSGVQSGIAENNQWYTSDAGEVTFAINEGSTPFAENDEFTFDVTESGLGHGTTVMDLERIDGTNGGSAVLYAATASGVFRSANGGLTWTEPGDFAGDNIRSLALHPDSNGTTDIIYAGTVDAGVWVSTNSGGTWTQYTGGIGKGLSATTPFADLANTGTGIVSEVTVGDDALSEYWDLTCIAAAENGGTFSVVGTVSGAQVNATVGTAYTSDGGEVSFTIEDGAVDFEVNDFFTFSTTRDPGNSIKDLLVDEGNNRLYALTYFDGPLEAHPVGNVYIHGLNANGSMATGDWAEANANLPQYDPPDDTTLFALHAIAPNIPDTPTALYIGGEGINLYKATSGLNTGNPAWQQSKSGLTNLIMARMPILFSGECYLYVSAPDIDDYGLATFTVYIEDTNGNPPISGSTFTAVLNTGEETIVLLDVTYGDAYVHAGTWRDPSDPDTNWPYEISTQAVSGYEVTFTFTPTCGDAAPGCSGSDQAVIYIF